MYGGRENGKLLQLFIAMGKSYCIYPAKQGVGLQHVPVLKSAKLTTI